MPLTRRDQRVVDAMRQREHHLERRQRATARVQAELARFEQVLTFSVTTGVAVIVAGLLLGAVGTTSPVRPWVLAAASIVFAVTLGLVVAHALLKGRWGRARVTGRQNRLRRKYSGDLHSGRRWLQFHYRDQEISAYVPQVLSALEAGPHDSVDEALASARAAARDTDSPGERRALALFAEVADQTNTVVVSTADDNGHPSSRVMRFVTTDSPGVWFLTTAPHGPKVRELDRGRVAVVTIPTSSGATISSNCVHVARADVPLAAIADLYEAQVPGYLDGLTEDEQWSEIVYELTLHSAKVDTWDERAVVYLAE